MRLIRDCAAVLSLSLSLSLRLAGEPVVWLLQQAVLLGLSVTGVRSVELEFQSVLSLFGMQIVR
jgi:hypothetical protein